MSQDSPSPPSTNAPPAAITNIKVAFALLAPPSPSSPTFHRRAGVANLFHDCIETDANKRLSNLSSTGYPPTLRRRGGVERAVLGREGVNCMAISLLLEIYAKRATLLENTSCYIFQPAFGCCTPNAGRNSTFSAFFMAKS